MGTSVVANLVKFVEVAVEMVDPKYQKLYRMGERLFGFDRNIRLHMCDIPQKTRSEKARANVYIGDAEFPVASPEESAEMIIKIRRMMEVFCQPKATITLHAEYLRDAISFAAEQNEDKVLLEIYPSRIVIRSPHTYAVIMAAAKDPESSLVFYKPSFDEPAPTI